MNQSRMPSALAGRFLAYTTKQHEGAAIAGTRSAPASGIVVRDRDPSAAVRRIRSAGYRSVVMPDAGAWAGEVATPVSPTVLHKPDTLFQIPLNSWASDLLRAGADAVCTPSKFVSLGNWVALRAVLRAGEETDLPEVVTLVATDAAMLDAPYLQTFAAVVVTNRPVAFTFADKGPPLQRDGRARGLRYLMSERPNCFLMATEPLLND